MTIAETLLPEFDYDDRNFSESHSVRIHRNLDAKSGQCSLILLYVPARPEFLRGIEMRPNVSAPLS